ncbi:MAG: hypothetical protein QOK37_1981 [Thermoanaerobaculia bacterium]|jgi:tetratricopeptide (TPR) repeat protein|nr:hypothetical protein [Thermoanaerobaculia bacterium]
MATLQDAVDAIDRGDDAFALEILNGLVEADPQIVDAWIWLATLAEAKNDLAEQRRCLDRIMALDPRNAEGRRILMRLQRADGGVGSALQLTRQESVPQFEPQSQELSETRELPEDEDRHGDSDAVDRVAGVAPSPPPPKDALFQSEPQLQQGSEERELADDEDADDDADAADHADEIRLKVRALAANPRVDKIGAPIWRRFFNDERHLIETLPSLLNDFIDAGKTFGADTARLDRLRVSATDGNSEIRKNLMVAVLRSGAELASALDAQPSCGQAFWIANALYEAGKIVSLREKTNTPKIMERLLKVAADSAVRLVRPSVPIDEAELALGRIIEQAQSTQYVGRMFAPVGADLGIVEKLLLDTIAAFFDRRLREMVENDRPSINEFVSTNMPKLYRMHLSQEWLKRRDAWEQAINDAGYDDTLRSLKSLGLLVRVDQIGMILPDARDQIRLAADAGDYAGVRKLLEPSEKELRNLLYKETQTALVFREPPRPRLKGQHRDP